MPECANFLRLRHSSKEIWIQPRPTENTRFRSGLQGSAVQAALARGLSLPGMRQRYRLPTECTAADSVPTLPSSDVADGPNAVREHPIALDHLVSRHFPADAKQDRNLGHGASCARPNRLAAQALRIMEARREVDDSKPLTGSVTSRRRVLARERRGGKRKPWCGRSKTPFVAAVACSF